MKHVIIGFLLYHNNVHSEATILYRETFETYHECSRTMLKKREEVIKSPFFTKDAMKLWKDGDGPIFYNDDGYPARHLSVKCLPKR